MVKERQTPILTLLENYKRKIMLRMQHRLANAKKWDSSIPLEMMEKLSKLLKKGRVMRTYYPGGAQREILDDSTLKSMTYLVNI